MKVSHFNKKFVRVMALVISAVMFIMLFAGCSAKTNSQTNEEPEIVVVQPEKPEENTKEENDIPEEPVPEEVPEPQPITYTLSFAGDCTLGTDYEVYGGSGTFVSTVGDDYGYPFKYAREYFENDDFTFVNLEGALTDSNSPAEKTYRFRGPMSYSKILTAGGIEAVNLANNHTYDFGYTGFEDTKAALESENILYTEDGEATLVTTESGLKIGLYAVLFSVYVPDMEESIAWLREQGAEIIIVSFHWGTEGSYRPGYDQQSYAHAAIDAGADIVFGHHPHVLQPIENYNDGVIYYSLGNFAFGGNRDPRDKDTAIIQQKIVREVDGTVHLGETVPIPFRLSSGDYGNNYQPIAYETADSAYERAMSKLNGTFTGPDLVPIPEEEEKPEEETPADGETPEDGTEQPPEDSTEGTEEQPEESLPEE